MTRWQLPIGPCIALTLSAATLLAGCPEDPAEAMLKQAQQGGASAAPPPSTPPAGGTPAAGGAPATPPGGAAAGERGAVPAMPPGTADDKTKPAGPEVTIDVKEIKAPYPRYSGKGRYDVTIDVAVTPSQDEGVWKVSALDEDGKVVGTREEQFVLLREKPRTLILDAFYCLRAPKSFKMELALDKNGNPKKATAAGGGVGAEGNAGQNGPGGVGPGGGGRGAGGGGDNGGGNAGGGGGAGGGDTGGGGDGGGDKGGGDEGGG